MKSLRLNSAIIVSWLMIMGSLNAMASSQEHFYNSKTGIHFATDSVLSVQDDKYGTSLWSTIQKNISVTDLVTLELNEDTTLFLIGKHTCKIDVEITYYNALGVADSLATSLSIAYDSTRSKRYNFRSTFKFIGGYKVKTKILAVFYDGMLTSIFPKVFTLAEDIYINRVYNFSCSTPQVPTDSFDNPDQRLVVSWTPVTGADEYDLEYTFYDDSSQVVKSISGSTTYTDFGFLFLNNATRVTVQGYDYAFSTVYNPGYIYYRVRPVHYDTLGNRVTGTWSSEIGSSTTLASFANQYQWSGHENYMNWQYTAAFAEQGKHKEVTSYFDGTLRNRQSVTLNNSVNKAIVGETIYDFEGRPAVTTLPAPIDTGKLWFYDIYNQDPSGLEYNRNDFDTGSCDYIPIGMDSVRGSSRYYSSSNPDTITGFDRFLPDAQGYPFTMTEYTPDMTGRISRQSIAGKAYRFGSGHETKYFYGKPSQLQLDRLFGSEVGYNSHYLENMAVDANGQISVSYIDENGKIIATALAGVLPGNVKPIGSYLLGDTVVTNLLDSTISAQQGSSMASSYVLDATNQARYYFTYKLFPGNYTDTSCSGAHICTDCLYDVQLMISGQCITPIVHYDSNLTYTQAFDTTCSHQNIVDTFSVFLTPGSYTITRTIKVDPMALSYYTNRFEQRATCLKTYSTFLTNDIANTNFTGCNMNCSTCYTALGSESSFLNKYITQLHNAGESISTHQDTLNADTAWTRAYNGCAALCTASSPCNGMYDQMLADVSLAGQYCLYDTTGGVYTPRDASSLLNSDYQNPTSPYLNSSGTADSVLINGQEIAPQQLTLAQFIQNWKPSWATSLVKYHPEYCFYTRCTLDSASNRYDNNSINTTSFSTACSGGYLAPLGFSYYGSVCSTSNDDPYFKSGGYGFSSIAWVKKKMDKYISFNPGSGTVTLSMWATAALMTYCSADTLSGGNLSGCYSPSDTLMGSGSCSGNLNMQWTLFRGLYYSLKQHLQDSLDSEYVITAGCTYANCIGLNTGACSGTPYASKTPRHVSLEYAASKSLGATSPSAATEKAYVDSAMTANCDSTCLSYAYNWYNKLDSCVNIHADSASLIQGLLAVCEAGCNLNHPLGASTTPNALPDAYGDISFEDVIHRVLGVSYSNIICNGSLISAPPPYYDSTGLTGPPVTYYKPTPCQCGNIDTAYSIYHKDSLSGETLYKNFGDFMTKYYGDSISEVTAWTIKGMCSSSCFFAPTPLTLPLWMSCCQDSMKSQMVTSGVNKWRIRASVGTPSYTPAALEYAQAFSIADSGYVIGGDSDYQVQSKLWRYDQSTNSWAPRKSDSAREFGVAFSIGGKGYAVLGENLPFEYLSGLRQYDPSTNSWSSKSPFPYSADGDFSFVIGDTAYIGCSVDTDGMADYKYEFWEYSSNADTWKRRTNFPRGGMGTVAFAIGNYGYAGNGFDSLGHLSREMWRFNPKLDKWDSIAPIPYFGSNGVAFDAVAFAINNKGYVGTGEVGNLPSNDTNNYTNQFWEYNPNVNIWHASIPYSGHRAQSGISLTIGNNAYVGTGLSGYRDGDSPVIRSDFAQFSNDSANYASPACCIICANMDTAMVHFGKVYPGITDTSRNYTLILTSYLNDYFGFDMTFTEYEDFKTQCDSVALNTIHLHDGTNLPITLCNQSLAQPAPVLDTNSCYNQLMLEAQNNATMQYNTYKDSVQNAFEANYISHCMNIDDSFNVKQPFDEYHYTLYYYDQAENLVKTVPPQGVHPITSAAMITSIDNYRNKGEMIGSATYPTDSMQTHYFYNTLNEPIKQQTPDGDSVHFWYDRLGRICLSQNAIQRPQLYSYTQYDPLGRIMEVGQLNAAAALLPSCFVCNNCNLIYPAITVLPDTFTRNDAELQHFINGSTKTQVAHTFYDSVAYPNLPLVQQNLRKRISTITYVEIKDINRKTYDNAIHYTYDIEGNVASILIDVPHDTIVKQRYKRINYYYDLISGNVNEIAYEQDSIDQFIHNYEYDADNRLSTVNTSHDSLFWEQDAEYEFYDHGPLAREVIGRRQVQGLDFAYTLNGWIKGVNSSINNPSYDMGKDGDIHDANNMVARDAYGYTLNYFTGDYRSIGKTNFESTGLPLTSLYSGSISGATYSIQNLNPGTLGYIYNYDQLNRYVGDSVFKNPGTNTWSTRTGINDLKENVKYDENGNILLYLRHGNTMNGGPLAMDSLTYHYAKGRNQLVQVNDAVPATNYTVDIDNETSGRNYQYNGIGQLARDSAGGLDTIIWNIYGKVKEIKKYNSDSIIYFYDAMGNRLEKIFYPHSATVDTTKYIRDAIGNIMAIYDQHKDTVKLIEWDIYGSGRLGVLDTLLHMQKPTSGAGGMDSLRLSYLEGQKQYELTNHLGNVLATVSDKKIPIDTLNTDTAAKYYLPLVINAQDYYPFGMVVPGRSYLLTGDSAYNYAFNDMMKDNQVYGVGDEYVTYYRGYDPRLGRWFSPDPETTPDQGSYIAMDDMPTISIDPDGDETVGQWIKNVFKNGFKKARYRFGGAKNGGIKGKAQNNNKKDNKKNTGNVKPKEWHVLRNAANVPDPTQGVLGEPIYWANWIGSLYTIGTGLVSEAYRAAHPNQPVSQVQLLDHTLTLTEPEVDRNNLGKKMDGFKIASGTYPSQEEDYTVPDAGMNIVEVQVIQENLASINEVFTVTKNGKEQNIKATGGFIKVKAGDIIRIKLTLAPGISPSSKIISNLSGVNYRLSIYRK